MFVSVITPTYNRGYILQGCYQSLCKQTCMDFEWIVVDDGSTDDTTKKIQGFIAENKVKIVYLKQENGGKHRAHNTGIRVAKGELVVCLDSDDQLTENAIERVKEIWREKKKKDSIGILALRGDITERKAICSHIPEGIEECTMYELSNKYGFVGDTVLFFKNEVLKNNLFVEFYDEKFLTEISLYYVLDQFGTMLLVDEVLYLCEYLEDGLTAKYFQLLRNNPNSSAYAYYVALCASKDIRLKVKFAILTQCYIQYIKSNKLFRPQKYRLLISLVKPIAMLYRKLRLEKLGGNYDT